MFKTLTVAVVFSALLITPAVADCCSSPGPVIETNNDGVNTNIVAVVVLLTIAAIVISGTQAEPEQENDPYLLYE